MGEGEHVHFVHFVHVFLSTLPFKSDKVDKVDTFEKKLKVKFGKCWPNRLNWHF